MKMPKPKLKQSDFILFSSILLITAIGVVMVYSASSYVATFGKLKNPTYFFSRQLIFAIIGIVCMIALQNFDYHRWKKFTPIFMLITVALLIYVLIFGVEVNGAKRWIDLKFTTFQPSEIAKYMVVFYMAVSIENKGEKIKTFLYGMVPYLLVSGLYAGLVLKEKNLSIASVIMIVTLLVLFVGGAQWKYMVGMVAGIGVLGSIFIYLQPYRKARFLSFLNPWMDQKNTGYQLIQSWLALGSGGVWGVGLGSSRQKCFYIPEPHNDFIFSIIGEELGLIGALVVILLFLVFIWRAIKIAMESRDVYGTMLAIGITSVIAVQAIINIAVVSGSIPVTGVPLPFVSSGGTSLVINLAAIGVLLNISRQTESKEVKD